MLTWAKRLALTFAVCATGVFLAGPALPASAQPGYGPTTAGILGTIVSAQACSPSGCTVTADVNGAVITVTVPAGDFPDGATVVFSTGVDSRAGIDGDAIDVFFAVAIEVDGVKQAGPFPTPIGVSVSDPTITANATVFVWNGSEYVPASGWTVSAGHASGSFDTDPGYLIGTPPTTTSTPVSAAPTTAAPAAAPATSGVVPGATVAVTGKPLIGESAAAAALVLGGVGAWRLRRRTGKWRK